jgi:hypothetical protein
MTPFTSSERSSKPGEKCTHGARIPPAALLEPPTPTVKTAQGTANANEPTNASSIGSMVKGKVLMENENVFTHLIAKIKLLCGFPADSTMVRYIDQQGWTSLEDVTLIGVQEVKDFFTVDTDGHFKTKPMMVHLRIFKAILLFYTRKRRESPLKMTEEDVLLTTKQEFNQCCMSDKYHFDLAISCVNETLEETTPSFIGNYGADMTMLLTTPVFQGCLEQKEEHYADLNDDEDFSVWMKVFIENCECIIRITFLMNRMNPPPIKTLWTSRRCRISCSWFSKIT